MIQTRAADEIEQRMLDDIRTFGWHIAAIVDNPNGPSFAYSIGLFHKFAQPEVIVVGLPDSATMGSMINRIGELMNIGHRFTDRTESDDILYGFRCSFRAVPPDVYPEYVGYAMWFYRPDSFPVLQCVWPDSNGYFPWQPQCQSNIRECQPVLASAIGWPFSEERNTAVITTRFVLDDALPILRVSHDSDGGWQFLSNDPHGTTDARIVALNEIVELCPAVIEVADLSIGWQAQRASPESPWIRSKLE